MREFMSLVGKILFIIILQTVIEIVVDKSKNPYHVRIIEIASILGCLYLLLDFVFNYILMGLTSMVRIPF